MKTLKILGIMAGLMMSANPSLLAEPVTGEACYAYGNSETVNGARHIALALAKRNALEEYPVYSDATANISDPQLKNEIITNLTVRAMKGIKVTGEEEDPAKKEVCRTVQVEVDPVQVKEIISAVFYAFYNRKGRIRTGLPENGNLRIIKAEEFSCPEGVENRCLGLVVECRRNTFGKRQIVRIIWHDASGLPIYSIKKRMSCEKARDIANFWLRLPPGVGTFSLDLP